MSSFILVLLCRRFSRAISSILPSLTSRRLVDVIHIDDRGKVERILSEVIAKGLDYHERYRMPRKDGTPIDAQMNAAAARDAKGEYIRTTCMIDSTEQLRE